MLDTDAAEDASELASRLTLSEKTLLQVHTAARHAYSTVTSALGLRRLKYIVRSRSLVPVFCGSQSK